MQFASLFVPFLIVPAGYARPRDVTRKQLGVWTLFNNIISCDDTKCFHSFDLYEQYDQEAQNCQFIVMATATSEPDRTDFQLVQCGSDGQFLVNGGHMTGSPDIVLVITNTMEMTWASFGYDQEEFLYGPHKESPSYHFGDFPTSNSEMAELIGLQPRCGWAMTEGRRVIDASGVHMTITMIDDNQDKVSCNVHLVPSMDTDYQSSSFYNRKCENSDWAMSWGYHPENDSAVMIMSDSTLRHQVWFRWIDVNSDIKLTPSESDIKTMLCGI